MSVANTLSLSNPEVIAFYQQHNLDFESMNVFFVGILRSMIHRMDTSLDSNLASQLLEQVSILKQKVDSISSVFDSRLADYRKEYLSDLKLIITSQNVEQMTPLIRDSTHSLIDKTTLLLNELLPKQNDSLSKDIQSHFQNLHQYLTIETNKLSSSSLDKKGIDDLLLLIQQTISQSNNTLLTLLSSSETRVGQRLSESDKKMDEIKEILRQNNFEPLQKSVQDVLSKFDYGIGKGTMSENLLMNTLVQHFPSADIQYVGDRKETGDILFQLHNSPKILIENKDHQSCNVPKHEVDKFIRDCDIQQCCGIMLSQHRGISNKTNFEIQINNGNILLFLHEVKFDIDKIKIAIDVIQNLKQNLDDINNEQDQVVIDKNILEYINKEFIFIINHKTGLMKLQREMNDKMLDKISEIKLPNLEQFLSQHFASSSKQKEYICPFCSEPIKKSLGQHLRYCHAKKDSDPNEQPVCTLDESSHNEHKEDTILPDDTTIRTKRVYKKKIASIPNPLS